MDNTEKYLENVRRYKAVFETEKGKEVLWDLMKAGGYTSSTFNENPYIAAHNEGARTMVIRIINLLEMDESKLKTMMSEQRKNPYDYNIA